MRTSVPTAVRERVVRSKMEAMDPAHTSVLLDATGLGYQPALEALIHTVGELGYAETPNYERCRDLLKALTKSLTADATTADSGTLNKRKHVLAEVNSRETHDTHSRKAPDKSESVVEKPSRRKPTVKQPQARNTMEVCGVSHSKDDEEEDEGLIVPSSNTTPPIGARVRPPARRSARTRRAMNSVFEPSDESGDDNDDNEEDFIPTPKRAQHQQKQQRTRSRLVAPGVATQTSPRLLRQLEREERRRNFF